MKPTRNILVASELDCYSDLSLYLRISYEVPHLKGFLFLSNIDGTIALGGCSFYFHLCFITLNVANINLTQILTDCTRL